MQLFDTKSDLKIKIQALQKDFFFKTEIVNCRYINCKYNIFLNSQNMLERFPEFKQTQIYGKETDAMLDEKFEYDEESRRHVA